MTITDPRLDRETTRVPRRSDYVKRPVLSATIHMDLKKTLVAMSERTGMSISQVIDEVCAVHQLGSNAGALKSEGAHSSGKSKL